MRFMPNKVTGFALALALTAGTFSLLAAAEPPAVLRIIPVPGLLLVDGDTVDTAPGPTVEIEIEPGEHVLRFFPYHTADQWYHRYLVYPFSVGSDGRREFDLTRTGVFTFRTDPQSAVLSYRGRFLGRTPGDFMLLLDEGDSVRVTLEGYEEEVLVIDRLHAAGNTDIFISLDPQIASLSPEDDELRAYQHNSPIRKLVSPDLMISLSTGVALLAVGAYFNQKADEHYERYQKLLGPSAREQAYDDAKHNDRLSKASFIVGDAALGIFGYLLVRRFIFPSQEQKNAEGKQPKGLSMELTTRKAQLSYRF
ncbi:MAG: hypothetical protein FVQ81_08345 [Candidatus Glassbacteria bacterium]|nr:hypothetical protein [Candidatus Glassbacteria bacterium]